MIEVGEYVRTDNGEIHKVEDIEDLRIHIETEKIMFRNWVEDYYGCHKEDRFIVKHSKNIIDLIEVGDYVNGDEITYINKDPFVKGQINLWIDRYETDSFGDVSRIKYLNNDIKTIVTKEQFKSIEYRLED